ncbi:histidine kinase N-terminal 7TM domain-containing protein [Haloarchaeobius sp. DT45]|uniref:histidine kinase N-terminal 7TM domain-containing protein n=1 Tax=Haloarchaeobius sp. DT45 TaxID=3446116 RepID=UPI003F6A6141
MTGFLSGETIPSPLSSVVTERLAYVSLLVLATAVLSTLSLYASAAARHRTEHRRTLLLFAVLMGSSAFWAGAYSLQLWSTTVDAKLFWLTLANLGTVVAPGSWFLFALSYTGKDQWLGPKTAAALAVEPLFVVLTIPQAATGRLYWYDVGLTTDPFPLLTRELGPLFHVHAVYSYVVILAGAAVLLQWSRRKQWVYRGQAALLTVGAILPVVSNAAFQVGIGPENINLTAPVFAVSGLAFWTAIARYRLLDVVPVAREAVVENMRDGYLVVDEQGRIVDTNPAATRLLRDSSLVGDRIDSVLPAAAGLLADLRDGGTDDGDDRTELAIGDDHDRRYVDMSVSPLGTETGSSLVVLRDITDRRSTERRFRALIENSSDLVTVVDENGTIEYQSPSTEQLLGHDPDAVTGKSALSYVHPDDHEKITAVFQAGLTEDEHTARTEYRVRHADGEWRIHEALSRNLLTDPAVEGVVVNSRDITERKRRERELAETNERLDQFASVVSHDLRNPLNVAQGYVELLDESVDGQASEYVDEVEESHDRMSRIIEDVLALARGGTDLAETEPVALDRLAREAWSNVETGEATLVTRTDQTVVADRSMLGRLFENLFRNSVEHGAPRASGEAGDSVEYGSTSNRGAPGDSVEHDGDDVTVVVDALPDSEGFVVADDGPGIDPDVGEQVFDPGVTRSASGTGLGLTIVERVVDAHGWKIRLAPSAVSDGSRDDGADESTRETVEVALSGARFEVLTGD